MAIAKTLYGPWYGTLPIHQEQIAGGSHRGHQKTSSQANLNEEMPDVPSQYHLDESDLVPIPISQKLETVALSRVWHPSLETDNALRDSQIPWGSIRSYGLSASPSNSWAQSPTTGALMTHSIPNQRIATSGLGAFEDPYRIPSGYDQMVLSNGGSAGDVFACATNGGYWDGAGAGYCGGDCTVVGTDCFATSFEPLPSDIALSSFSTTTQYGERS